MVESNVVLVGRDSSLTKAASFKGGPEDGTVQFHSLVGTLAVQDPPAPLETPLWRRCFLSTLREWGCKKTQRGSAV